MDRAAHLVPTERDLNTVLMVHSYGGCTLEHIRHRFFPTPGARSACYDRISRLVKADYLESTRLPSSTGIGSGKLFLLPGHKARPILARMLGLSRTELGRIRTDSPLFIQHHLAICDIRLAFEIANEQSTVFSLREWTGDHELRQAPIKVTDPTTKKVTSFVPDASLTLSLADGSEQTFLLELDLSTLSPKRCREKLRCYLIRAKKDPSPILFVTPDKSRCDALSTWAKEEAAKLKTDATIFWLTTKDQVSEKTVLDEPIWQIVGGPQALALRSIAPAPTRPPATTVRHYPLVGV